MKRLLLVDDDPDVLDALVEVLSEEFEVSSANDGVEAMDHLRTSPCDVVLLDMMMPNMDGEEVVVALREAGLTVPVLLGSAMPGLRRIASRLGVAAIAKPYAVQTLVERLKALSLGEKGAEA